MRNKYTCDLCGTERVESAWDTKPLALSLTTRCHSQNPMAVHGGGCQVNVFALDEVCPQCHKSIAKQLADAISALKAQRK